MIVFQNEELIPAAWRHLLSGGPVRVFNPGLLPNGDGWILAYRIVFEADGRRRLALCRLDRHFAPIEGSSVPYSDAIGFPNPDAFAEQALTWFADPRLYRLLGRTYVYWNSGWHEPSNHQFLQEFDPVAFVPLGAPRELHLAGRQKLEKNWALFECDDAVYAIYSVNPHRVLRVPLSAAGERVRCEPLSPPASNDGGFAQAHGGLRGGAPPQLRGDRFVAFCHAIENDAEGYSYVAAAYEFHCEPPFAIVAMPDRPLRLELPPSSRRQHPKLNPAVGSVIYPSGAAFAHGRWAVSVGIDDERCAIAFISDADLGATLKPVNRVR